MTATFDHAVWAGPRLEALVDELADRTGVRPTPGGAHEGLGTHNALLGLGPGRYLELLAPQPGEADRSPFAKTLAALPAPRVFMWAVRVPDVEDFVARGEAAGLAIGAVASMSRTEPGGETRQWRLSTGGADVYGGVLPFGIAWTTPGHPSDGLAPGCRLASLAAEHPEPERIARALEALGCPLRVDAAERAALVAEIESPRGVVELR